MSPLAGIKVLDFGQGVAGPYCAQLLADHGADVIKVEPPRGDWARMMGKTDARGYSGTFISVNRNKRGICLDLKDTEAIGIARQLALRADVMVESFRHGVMDRLGLGFEDLRHANPRLVYVSVTGFGPGGPNVDLPASDSIMQAYGGLMSIVGMRDGEPLRIANMVSDMIAGINAFSGALLGLLRRVATGQGSRVDVSLLDSIVAFQAAPITEYLLTGDLPKRLGNDHPLIAPSGAMQTADSAVVFAVLDHQWAGFCTSIGTPELEGDPCFSSNALRLENRHALRQALDPLFRSRTTQQWLADLRRADVLCGPINDYAALMADEQVRYNELLQHHSGFPLVRNAVHITNTEVPMDMPPALGEHTRSILLGELDFTEEQIQELARRKVVHL